jgi:hypothetical protein
MKVSRHIYPHISLEQSPRLIYVSLQEESKEKAWLKGAAGKMAANADDDAFASLAKPKAKKVRHACLYVLMALF